MNISLKNIPHYTIIFVSVAYNSYTAGNYAQQMFNPVIAFPASCLLSLLAHHYLFSAIQATFSNRKIDMSVFVAVFLSGLCIMADLQGVSHVQESLTVAPVTTKYEQQITDMESALLKTQKDASSARTRKLRADLLTLAEQQKEQLETKRAERIKTLTIATAKAEQQATGFQVLSIALFFLSASVSTLIQQPSKKQSNVEEKTAKKHESDDKTTLPPTLKEITDFDSDRPQNKAQRLQELWQEDVKDTSRLAKLLKVNFKELKELKIKAGIL